MRLKCPKNDLGTKRQWQIASTQNTNTKNARDSGILYSGVLSVALCPDIPKYYIIHTSDSFSFPTLTSCSFRFFMCFLPSSSLWTSHNKSMSEVHSWWDNVSAYYINDISSLKPLKLKKYVLWCVCIVSVLRNKVGWESNDWVNTGLWYGPNDMECPSPSRYWYTDVSGWKLNSLSDCVL